MSELMTKIQLPGYPGIMDWGRLSTDQMIMQIRKNARHDLEAAQAILAAKDDDFKIDVVRGPHVQRHVQSLQPGRKTERRR